MFVRRTYRLGNRPGLDMSKPDERQDTGDAGLDGYTVLDRADGARPRRGIAERKTELFLDRGEPEN